MRYIAAAALHAKALKVLAVIEEAEGRIEEIDKYLERCEIPIKNLKHEFELWFLGKPSLAEQERYKRHKATHEAAHRRLCAYYSKILSRLIDLQ